MVLLNFLLFFWNFILRVGWEQNEAIIFIFSLFQPILALNEAATIFFNFLAILLEFSITCRVGTERNDNFYFLAFPSFSNLFWVKMNP